MYRVATFLVVSLLLVVPVLALEGFSAPRDAVLSEGLVVSDTAVYSTGYLSDDGSNWQAFNFTGKSRGNWVIGQATADVATAARYYAFYSCTWNAGWDCSATWQVLDTHDVSDYVPTDSVQGDFEALQALYASTQGQGVEVLDSVNDLPAPADAQYPYMYIIDGEIWALSKERLREIGVWENHGSIWKDTTGWDDMTPETMGDAVGVEVDADGRVVVLDMQKVTTAPADGGFVTTGNGLIGTLPEEIGNLRRVHHLNLKQNFLIGEIPDVFANWSSLERFSLGGRTWELNIDYRVAWHESDHRRVNDNDDPYTHRTSGKHILSTNNFQSELPASLGSLPNLELIEVAHQYLYGSLPPEWGNLPKIRAIYLTDIRGPKEIQFGSIPTSWGDLDTMEVFSLSQYHTHQRFSGQLPPGMKDWSNLSNFVVGGMSGPVPEFQGLHDLVYFALSGDFAGQTFPWESVFNGNNSRLSSFSISRSGFVGEIPQSIPPAMHPVPRIDGRYDLDRWTLRENQFSGSFPEWMADVRGLQIIDIVGNNFSGPFPVKLLNQSNLKTVRLSDNQFSGPLPDAEWTTNRIRWFYINGNNFEGEIPDSWQTLFQHSNGEWVTGSNFARYLFHDNNLSGRVPDWAKQVDWGGYQRYWFNNNEYVFRDFVDTYQTLNLSFGSNFRIDNQKPFGESTSLTLNAGDSLVIDSFVDDVSHPDNVYAWSKDGELLAGQTSKVFEVSSASTSDAGVYTLEVQNTRVPDTTLYSQEVSVIIS